MDSRQVYRGMDIGTAKATAAQRAMEDALVPIMTGLVRAMGWMDPVTGLGSIPVRRE